jgi:DNA replication protein DnaC
MPETRTIALNGHDRACALGHKACRDDRSVLYYRVPRLLDALALARGDGRYVRLLKSLARVELLILDDWGLAPLTSETVCATDRLVGIGERLAYGFCDRRPCGL